MEITQQFKLSSPGWHYAKIPSSLNPARLLEVGHVELMLAEQYAKPESKPTVKIMTTVETTGEEPDPILAERQSAEAALNPS